ncbi:MAG: MarR family transcriptional regulator [Actinobacteria bacterium]|nr:MarR family transcriptional regulator [Actinomycetota bacterium]
MSTRRSAQSVWLARPEADREAWNNFRKAAGSVIAQVDADLQQHLKVGYTDIDALLQLSAADEHCLRMAPLARAVSRSPSAMTRLVDRLEERSLVERKRNSPTDVSVEVTDSGLELLAEAAPRIITQVEERFWSRLTADERDALSSICRKLIEPETPNC